jgi:hypothetical protein
VATPPAGASGNVLQSDWTGLSPHLIARFYPVMRTDPGNGKPSTWVRVPDSVEVRAPITEASIEGTFNWTSPFENTGADQSFSAISAMLQTGALAPILGFISQSLADVPGGSYLQPSVESVRNAAKGLEGKSSVTKLNSTQVFNGAPPMKVSLTVHFRALKDARAEVERPLNQLMSWAVPQELAADGPVLTLARLGDPSLYPSKIPQIIGMQYADMQLLPLVIESAPYPLGGPRDKNGTLLSAQSALQLSTLSALDARDWAAATPFRSPR